MESMENIKGIFHRFSLKFININETGLVPFKGMKRPSTSEIIYESMNRQNIRLLPDNFKDALFSFNLRFSL